MNNRAVPNLLFTLCDPTTYASLGVTTPVLDWQRPVGRAVPLFADAPVQPVLYNPFVWQPVDTATSIGTAGETQLQTGRWMYGIYPIIVTG